MTRLTDRIAGRRVVASISGGKDSAAMSLWLTEQGIDHDRVFLDTGWEHELTYEYLRGPLTEKIGPIIEIRGTLSMEGLVRKKGIFPSRLRRFCTEQLKVLPMKAYLNGLVDAGADVINAVGIRAAESEARSKMPEWEWSAGFDCETWRPMIHWDEQAVIDIHHKHGLRPNPLYLLGARRVGCWPCIYAGRDELRLVAAKDPDRIVQIRKLEADVTERARSIVAARGEELTAPRTFFRERQSGKTWTIDDAVAWAQRPARGESDQLEMFAPAKGEEGCMRWGLCDTGSK